MAGRWRRRMLAATGSSAAAVRGMASRCGAGSMLWAAFGDLIRSAIRWAGGSGSAPGSGVVPEKGALSWLRKPVSSARYTSWAASRGLRLRGVRPQATVRACMDVRGARADLAGVAAGQCPGALDRPHGPAHRLHRPGARERKLQRDGKILDAELAEQPDDPFMLFNPGSVAVEGQNWPAALAYHQRACADRPPPIPSVRKLFALIARCQVSQTRDSDGEKLPSPRPVRPIQRRQGAFRERPQGGRGRP